LSSLTSKHVEQPADYRPQVLFFDLGDAPAYIVENIIVGIPRGIVPYPMLVLPVYVPV
jgi:hypothetical protein